MSFTKITREINKHLKEEGEQHIGRSSVYTAYLNLQPEETIIKKRKQCGGQQWATAGWRWCAQKMNRLGQEIPDEHKPWDINKPTPDCFDLEYARGSPLIVRFGVRNQKTLHAHLTHFPPSHSAPSQTFLADSGDGSGPRTTDYPKFTPLPEPKLKNKFDHILP